MKNFILILVATMFAFGVSAQTDKTDKAAKPVNQKEISVMGKDKDQTATFKFNVISKDEAVKIEKELQAIKGVKKVVMNVSEGIATVTYSEDIVKPNTMADRLKKAGFPAKIETHTISKDGVKKEMKVAPKQEVKTKDHNIQR